MVHSARPSSEAEVFGRAATTQEVLWRHLRPFWQATGDLDPHLVRVLHRIRDCRTPAMGTHLCVCGKCGWNQALCNSCRDRHCPQCQGAATADWLAGQQRRMLAVPHFQVVFTLPAELRDLAFDNQDHVYACLMRSAASVLQDLAEQRLGARLGITAVLHTWTSELTYHPHVHLLVSAGGLAMQDDRWVGVDGDYLFPQRILGAMFRGRMLEALIEAVSRDELVLRGESTLARKQFRTTMRALAKRHARWVVHIEPPAGRPVAHIAKYLARYVKRVAIADARIVWVTESEVSLHTRRGQLTLTGVEFIRRFCLHILPPGFRKVRHYGLYAPANHRRRLALARSWLQGLEEPTWGPAVLAEMPIAEELPERCPACGEPAVRRLTLGWARPEICSRGSP